MARKTPAWQLMGLDGPPPVDRFGYHDYGIVFDASAPRRRFHETRELAKAVYWFLWSWYYWGKKVRKGVRELLSDVWGVLRGRPWPAASPEQVEKPRIAA